MWCQFSVVQMSCDMGGGVNGWMYDMDIEEYKYTYQGYITQFQEEPLTVKLSN